MSLFEKESIIKVYIKKAKKSICSLERIDMVFILSILIFLIFPLVISPVLRLNKGVVIKHKELFLSPRCEEFFGKDVTETLLREFAEMNPDLRISLLNGDTQGREADILIFDEGDFSRLSASAALLPLEAYSGSETSEGQFAIPLVSFMDLLFYNIDLLKDARFDRPPKTREEFLAYAKAVSSGGIATGAALSLSPADEKALSRDVFSWIWASGGDFWEGEDAPVINSRPVVRDIAFLGSLYRENALAPQIFETTGNQRLEEFANGKIAMMVASTRAIPYLREKMGDGAFGVTTVPGSGLGGKYSLALTGFYAGINAASEYPDEAWKFLEFLAGQSPLLCAELKAVPGIVSDLFYGDYMKDDPFYSKARDIFESSQIVRGFFGIPGAEKFESAVREEMQAFFETGRTADQTAAAIQRRWDNKDGQ